MLIAAAIHDFEHPGVNNAYLANVQHGLALRYNNISILEAHSCAAAYLLINNPLLDPFHGFTRDERQDARNLIIDAVLATDLAHHAKLLMEFKAAVNHPQNTNPKSPEAHREYVKGEEIHVPCTMYHVPTGIRNAGRTNSVHWSRDLSCAARACFLQCCCSCKKCGHQVSLACCRCLR